MKNLAAAWNSSPQFRADARRLAVLAVTYAVAIAAGLFAVRIAILGFSSVSF